jgi:arginine deiminase
MTSVTSEIGRLRTVLVHRPGREIENLTPDLLEKLLFDDIPYMKVAQAEHDAFVRVMKDEGVEVLYLTDLMEEALLAHPKGKSNFINAFIEESKVKSHALKEALYAYFAALPDKEMVTRMIEGVRTHQINLGRRPSIMDMLEDEYPFLTDPLPNLFFQRDPFVAIGKGAVVARMSTTARTRETLFPDFILTHHPRFMKEKKDIYYDRLNRYQIEGGDVLVLSEKVVAIGISKRTDPRAIEHLAEKLFTSGEPFETVLAFNIPKSRAFMHLDTVFTQADHGIFTIHPGIEKVLTVFELTRNGEGVNVEKVTMTLEDVLEKHLGIPVRLIRCGGNDMIASTREQWNDGANTLSVAPGKVIVYDRNHVTNALLRDAGVTVLEIPSSELSRGRGGPRCMTMPLVREPIGKGE